MLESLLFEFMIIGVLGVGSQWLAWRFQLPSIVIMSIAGLLIGPVLGVIYPAEDFGELYRPIIAVAIAVILFEGSLSLEFKELKGLGKTVMRFVTIGAGLRWLLGALAAYFVAGLSWPVAFVLSALLIVTGPTVILPLLRQSKLRPRPAKILKWEGIITDPIGALLAVFAFEILRFIFGTDVDFTALVFFFVASLFAILLGFGFGRIMGWLLEEGHVPEFFKSPVVLIAVISCFTIADEVQSETGLLSVTVMGITMANMGISAVQDMRNFKENISTLFVSAIFIMLTASLTRETLAAMFTVEIISYVLVMLFVVRPLSIFITTINSELSWQEKLFVGWIAPRGIVAITVAGYFASLLTAGGFAGAELINSVTFALVFVSVVAHGFSMPWLAKKLGLSLEGHPGMLFIGSNPFIAELGSTLKEMDVPVLVVDPSGNKLKIAREKELNVKQGEILAEHVDGDVDLTPYEYLIAGTNGEAYNTLVVSSFLEEFGRNRVFKLITKKPEDSVEHAIPTPGGRVLFSNRLDRDDLIELIERGGTVKRKYLTEAYTYEEFLNDENENPVPLLFMKPSGELEFFEDGKRKEKTPQSGDVIVYLAPSFAEPIEKEKAE